MISRETYLCHSVKNQSKVQNFVFMWATSNPEFLLVDILRGSNWLSCTVTALQNPASFYTLIEGLFIPLFFICKKPSPFQSDTTLAVLESSLNYPSYPSVNEWKWRSYVGVTILYFSGAYAKLRKATISFVPSVPPPACPLVLMEQPLLPLDEFS